MSQETEVEQRVVAIIVGAVIVGVIALAVGLGIAKSRGDKPAAATAPALAVVEEAARVVVENGVVKFYFAVGKAEVAAGGAAALAEAVTAGKAGQRLAVSGYHDSTGDAATNAELAKQRALAVQALLIGAGVADAAIELRKPEALQGTGSDAEARRVEVVIVR